MDKPTKSTKNRNDSSPHNNTKIFSKLHSFTSQNPYKKSLLPSLFCFPTSVLALTLIFLLTYNSFTIFYINIPIFSCETVKEITDRQKNNKLPTSQLLSNPILTVQEEASPLLSTTTDFASLNNSATFASSSRPRSLKSKKAPKTPTQVAPSPPRKRFSSRVRKFFLKNSCEVKVFMTWISSLESFQERERFTIESLFKSHTNACLLIVSDSMDSVMGDQILRPFWRLNFRAMAVSPDYRFVFKRTMAAAWYDQLVKGNIRPGEVSLGQNLSNLLRLALLYKYGGIYMDTDFIVLRRLDKLCNSIGAQNVDQKTRNWSRLNNALMVFDKKHPLLKKFIEEFALTFNGNKWGHNGPYLVSRVVERLNVGGKSKGVVSDFTILPPSAFYPVDWGRIGSLFQRPKDEVHLKWVRSKLKQIEEESYVVHLWNRQSRGIVIEEGSIISHLMKGFCVFCNSSSMATM